jgi:hypothetical protein
MYFRLASMLPLTLNDRWFGPLVQALRQAFIGSSLFQVANLKISRNETRARIKKSVCMRNEFSIRIKGLDSRGFSAQAMPTRNSEEPIYSLASELLKGKANNGYHPTSLHKMGDHGHLVHCSAVRHGLGQQLENRTKALRSKQAWT